MSAEERTELQRLGNPGDTYRVLLEVGAVSIHELRRILSLTPLPQGTPHDPSEGVQE